MTLTPSHWLDLVLALGAIWYSFMPADRVPGHRRGIALVLRYSGLLLLVITVTHWVLTGTRR